MWQPVAGVQLKAASESAASAGSPVQAASFRGSVLGGGQG